MTTPKSQQVLEVDRVQAALHELLRSFGFRKQGRTFNRRTEDALVQVVSVQMGAHDLPGTTYVPGLREDLYGWFTVNLGVYVPEVAKAHGDEAGAFVREVHCCIRERLGSLGPERKDLWWRNDAFEEAVPDLLLRMDHDGLPFLTRFATRDAILREWKDTSENQGAGSRPPRIVMAIILAARGEEVKARDLLVKQASETGFPGHRAYVQALAGRLGIPIEEPDR